MLCESVAAVVDMPYPMVSSDELTLTTTVDSDGEGASTDTLRESAKGLVRARTEVHQDAGLAVTAWQGLVDGTWSFLDHFESDGRRYWIVHRNDPAVAEARALTAREREVLTLLGRGMSNPEIARTLGLRASTVGTHAANLLAKLGIRSRIDLIQLVAHLDRLKRSSIPFELDASAQDSSASNRVQLTSVPDSSPFRTVTQPPA